MASPTLDQIVTEIDQWFKDTMHNSVVSREVAVYNHVRASYEELKNRIAALVTGKPTSAPEPAPAAEVPTAEASAPDSKSKPAA